MSMSKAEPKDGLRVLSCDGPPIPEAALSELFFLQQIAHRWAFNEDNEDEIEGNDVRVGDMFDIIGGSGMGGLYAILFARLNMTIGQVIQFHNMLIQNLFSAACWTEMGHQQCTKTFNDALDCMVSDLGIAVDLDSPFQGKDFTKCFIVVLNKTKASTHAPRLLRSFRARVDPSPRCTIRQALHATLTDIEHLPAVTIDDEDFIRSSAVFPNPSRILQKDLAANFPKLHLACLINVGADWTHPPNDSHTVGQDLMAQFRNLGCFFRLSLREELNQGSQIRSLVMAYLREDVTSRMCDDIVDALQDNRPVVKMLRLGDLAGEDGKHALRADISQLRNDGDIKRALERLRGPFDFPSLHEHGCLKGTRVDVLEHIDEWAKDVNAPNVFWLEGYPGTGKTFISISLKQRLAEAGILGASCFFRREDASHHRLDTLVRSIAFQLAGNHDFILDALVQAINSGVVRFEGAPATLFTHLIYDPLAATCTRLNKCIVIVLDALDEFGRSDADQLQLLTLLLPRWTQLPLQCKLFIASRSQGVLPRHLDLPVHRIRRLAIGDDASAETINDIRIFLDYSLENIQNSFNSSTSLVTESQLETLAKASSGLFIWASTVVQMVKQQTLRKTARRLLQNLCTQRATIEPTKMQPLYKLYRTVLDPLLGHEEARVVELPPDVLSKETFFSALARARIPLSANALASLCKADVDDIQDMVLQLAPVMDSARGLRFVHKSFADYVPSQDFPLLLDFDAIELSFTDSCFKIMHTQLHFNMGNMPSSYLLNSEIPTLHHALSEELQYASRFWGSHLKDARSRNQSKDITFAPGIDAFLRHQLLYWIEAMSILGCIREATETLSLLRTSELEKEVGDFAQDALSFLRRFALPISESYPHIYVSAIPWAPKNSLIRTGYHKTVSHVLKIVSNEDETWPAQLDVIKGHNDGVCSVAFSPDGFKIVSGSKDSTIRIWDATTRQPIGEPLRGHRGVVNSVAFSPNSSQIVSGSDDATIRIWDAATHQPFGGPLRVHNFPVLSVAFSPDGSQIVSELNDSTIRIWDAATRQPIGEPLRGHYLVNSVALSPDGSRIVGGCSNETIQVWDTATRQRIGESPRGHYAPVNSVAFSPDGSQIVSGCGCKFIRIWDAATCLPIGKTLLGHYDSVNSVAFSPDGSQIVSGSDDETVRIWDATTRQPIGEPLRGHRGVVNSVAFSPDGSQIVSGSDDATIRIWDAATHQPFGGPFRVHNFRVLSVAFSPDGSQIFGRSDDATIRIWDAATRQPIGEPLRAHNHWVNSVALSPDSSQIVSGSADNTIQIWDAATRQPIGESLRGHNSPVLSVAFSPDGLQIVSGSRDNSIRIWDATTRQPIGEPLRGHNSWVTTVAFSPDGSQIISSSLDRTIRMWDTAPYMPIDQPIEALKILSFSRGSQSSPLYCFLLPSGWVVDQHNYRLVWIPYHDLQDFLPTPGLIDIIGPRRMVVIDASDMRTGTEWSSCVDTH